jgi:hypothetical protein
MQHPVENARRKRSLKHGGDRVRQNLDTVDRAAPELPEDVEALDEALTRLAATDPKAAEVGELLSQHLAHLQQPALVPRPAAVAPASRERQRPETRMRQWGIAAALLLVCCGGFGLTEANGVTRVVAPVVHVFTPDGTLVVVSEDPSVKVTIEGWRSCVPARTGGTRAWPFRPTAGTSSRQ